MLVLPLSDKQALPHVPLLLQDPIQASSATGQITYEEGGIAWSERESTQDNVALYGAHLRHDVQFMKMAR